MSSGKGAEERSPLELRREEKNSRHRSRHHDREKERSRSPQNRLTSRASQDSKTDSKHNNGSDKHRRQEREREEGRQRGDGERKEGRRRGRGEREEGRCRGDGEREEGRQRGDGEREEGRQRGDGEREDGRRRGDGEREEGRRRVDEKGEEGRWRGDREREEGRWLEEGEREDRRQGEEDERDRMLRREGRRREGGGRGEGKWRLEGDRREGSRREEGEREEGRRREETGLRHEQGVREKHTSTKDVERQKRREQRIAEDEEAKSYEFGGAQGQSKDENNKEKVQKEEPNFGLSGKLTAETNTYKGVVIKYSEPTEARQPTTRWRLYQFKGEEVLPTLYIHRQSAYLVGRDRRVVDVPVDHPSCSSQHAVLQYRLVNYEKKDGSTGKQVRPYLIDLESTNGTYLNNQRIEPARYWELKEKDMIKFGFSSREYILLHENSHDVNAVS